MHLCNSDCGESGCFFIGSSRYDCLTALTFSFLWIAESTNWHCLVPLQMEACAMAIPSGEVVVDFAFYKAGQVALLLKDKARASQVGSSTCRLVLFQLADLPFMHLEGHSNGTNQMSQHVIEVGSGRTSLID